MHIRFPSEYVFNNVKIIDDFEKIREVRKSFPDALNISDNEWEIIV